MLIIPQMVIVFVKPVESMLTSHRYHNIRKKIYRILDLIVYD